MTELTIAVPFNMDRFELDVCIFQFDVVVGTTHSDDSNKEMLVLYTFVKPLDKDTVIKIARELSKNSNVQWYLFK